MVYTILKGFHYSLPPLCSPVFGDKDRITKFISFDNSCRYDLESEDQLDVNKLWGVGYFPSHHQNSVRFGWRYDKAVDMIEILAYWYKDGARDFSSLGHVGFNERVRYTMWRSPDSHRVRLDYGPPFLVPVSPQKIGYTLRPYFGGNRTAPHTMKIMII